MGYPEWPQSARSGARPNNASGHFDAPDESGYERYDTYSSDTRAPSSGPGHESEGLYGQDVYGSEYRRGGHGDHGYDNSYGDPSPYSGQPYSGMPYSGQPYGQGYGDQGYGQQNRGEVGQGYYGQTYGEQTYGGPGHSQGQGYGEQSYADQAYAAGQRQEEQAHGAKSYDEIAADGRAAYAAREREQQGKREKAYAEDTYSRDDLYHTGGWKELEPVRQSYVDPSEPDDDEPSARRDYLAAGLWTAGWVFLPLIALLIRALFLSGQPDKGCVATGLGGCASARADALAGLISSSPQWSAALFGALALAMLLRWASDSWRAVTLGFCAAVVAGGATTVLFSITR